jgi:hypothetical protein
MIFDSMKIRNNISVAHFSVLYLLFRLYGLRKPLKEQSACQGLYWNRGLFSECRAKLVYIA